MWDYRRTRRRLFLARKVAARLLDGAVENQNHEALQQTEGRNLRHAAPMQEDDSGAPEEKSTHEAPRQRALGFHDSRRLAYVSVVEGGSGGRLVLRLVSAGSEAVEYEGELSAPDGKWSVSARVGAEGEVDVERPADAPDWLVATTRATLRTAWRARKAGTPWPRRLSRWRAASDDEGAER